eukprot:scaffold120107_cov75-Phaeocystis_antarctica.AAC.2
MAEARRAVSAREHPRLTGERPQLIVAALVGPQRCGHACFAAAALPVREDGRRKVEGGLSRGRTPRRTTLLKCNSGI